MAKTLRKQPAKGEQKEKLSNHQKKEYAKLLYLKDNLKQKEIAEKVGVAEKTLSIWVNTEKWDEYRTAMYITKEEQIRRTYGMIRKLQDEIEDKGGIPDSKQADILSKLSATVSELETEAGLAEIIGVCKDITDYIRKADLAKAQEFVKIFDGYIKTKLSA